MSDISFNNWQSMTDKALLESIGAFIAHHRVEQNKSQNEVAKDAQMSRSTLSLLENGENVSLSNLIKVLRVLDLLHIFDVFAINTEISPIAYAKLKKKERKRASKVAEDKTKPHNLGW